jgi:hypothetical protein
MIKVKFYFKKKYNFMNFNKNFFFKNNKTINKENLFSKVIFKI